MPSQTAPLDFIRRIVAEDLETGRYDGRVVTRFPPEPNGYLHIGHAKAICLSHAIATENGGMFHLRFDDTNPSVEREEYVLGQQEDIRWLGCDWGEHLYFASDYFGQLCEYAVQLIRAGKAYVCDLSGDQIREYRGTLTEPGRDSPYRNRSIEENLDLFARMRAREFDDGERVLRAKIDMASPNLSMRDPVLYRIQRVSHHRTGDAWCIYPMYDFSHCLSDSIERVTHSFCTLEFENQRPLYDWFLDELDLYHPQQIEFGPLRLEYTMLGKRKLVRMIEEGTVSGWDDPRLPTLRGLRRRGYTPESIRDFMARVGVARKDDSSVQLALLEHCLREDLNRRAPRVMGVLRPLKIVIENYPEAQLEELQAVNNPEDPEAGTRAVPFSRELWIERDDFREDPPRKFYRLAPGREVRLRYAYFITCTGVVKDERTGEVIELRCRYDPATRGGDAPDGRKVKATLHWVSADQSLPAEVRLYEPLFTDLSPDAAPDYHEILNPNALERLVDCRVEKSLAGAPPGSRWQLERQGYFCVDPDTSSDRLVLNRAVSLRDSWARIERRARQDASRS